MYDSWGVRENCADAVSSLIDVIKKFFASGGVFFLGKERGIHIDEDEGGGDLCPFFIVI